MSYNVEELEGIQRSVLPRLDRQTSTYGALTNTFNNNKKVAEAGYS